MKHGSGAYRTGKCKCSICKKAHAELQARYRKKYGRKATDSAFSQRKLRGY